MNDRVLFVDDEPNILDGIRRQLRKRVTLETAVSGEEGLQKIREGEPFAVVVSDMRMPGMNGAGFLGEVRKISPDSIRMILSGQAELESTIEAVNQSHIFRFLTKPCSIDSLYAAVEACMEQHRLVHAERVLLEQTLSGAVRMLTEILGIINPVAHNRASRIQRYARDMVATLGLVDEWQLRLATMLSQLGCITLPGDTLARIYAGQDLAEEEMAIYASHPQVAGRLLSRIPRLEGVAEIISHQMQEVDLTGLPEKIQEWDTRMLGGIILRAATDLDDLVASGVSAEAAVSKLEKQTERLPEQVRKVLRSVKIMKEHVETRLVTIAQLEIGMVLDEDVMSANGTRLIPRGQEVTHTILIRLQSFSDGVGVVEPFRVNVLR